MTRNRLAVAVALGALLAASAAAAGGVPNPVNAPASIAAGHVLCASGTNPQQAADCGAYLSPTGDASNMTVTSPLGSQSITSALRTELNINVADFGALGTSDDSGAINVALTWARTQVSTNHKGVRLSMPAGIRSTITGSINMTGFDYPVFIFDLNGSNIYCSIPGGGKPCIDALGSTSGKIVNGAIIGDATNIANNGVQVGRIAITTNSTPFSGANFAMENLTITGSFSNCGYLNFASEETVNLRLSVYNAVSSGTAFSVCYDGANHLNTTSNFVTQTAPTDQAQSFNNDQMSVGTAQCSVDSACIPFFFSGTRDFIGTGMYGYTNAGAYCLEVYSETSSVGGSLVDSNPQWDLHCETNSGTPTLTDMVLVSGLQASPAIIGLRFTEPALSASNSLFKIDGTSSVTSASCQGCEIKVTGGATTPTAKFFDSAKAWTLSGGSAYAYYPAMWNAPAGSLTTRVTLGSLGSGPFGPLDFLPAACGGFSVRRMSVSYTGPLMGASNGTTNAQIYQNANGDLDISSASAFLAANSGLFSTWYWQGASGGNNATQSTAASQPGLTLQVAALGGRPAAVFGAGGAAAMTVADAAPIQNIFATGGFVSDVVDQIGIQSATNRLWQKANIQIIENTANQYLQSASTSAATWTNAALSNGAHVMDLTYTAGSPGSAFNANLPVITYDGTAQTVTLTTAAVGTVGSDVGTAMLLGNSAVTGGVRGYPGDIAEHIMCQATPSALQLEAVRRNQAVYYGIEGVN